MTKYIFDTNITSIIGREEQVAYNLLDRLSKLADEDVMLVSVLTLYESNYGLKNATCDLHKQEIEKNINFVQKYFEIIPLDLKEMDIYAQLKVAYKKHTGISKNDAKKNDIDLLIASSAVATNATLISNDRIFETLSKLEPRLKYENWL
ncbi:MAG: type II toxin-antitoxin system VapC family toxin [Campylobacterota bacterium]|nr:type II toxin-antitoxin system VapC family toxin [Campylobacterota bacterium]